MVRSRIYGLYAVTPDAQDTAALALKVRQAVEGGARALQYRNKSSGARARHEQAQALLAICRGARVPMIVNDDVELALSIGADGVHIGREDGDIALVRKRAGKNLLLGVSCYNRIELALAAVELGADYVAFGSAFSSPTKPAAVHAPLELFREARGSLAVPIVAIGGITPQNGRLLIDAGADAVAVISALFDAPDVGAAATAFDQLFTERDS